MGNHIVDGEFQSDKYPTCPRGKVPLSIKDKTAQDLLWEYAQRRRSVDAEFSKDLETALKAAGYNGVNQGLMVSMTIPEFNVYLAGKRLAQLQDSWPYDGWDGAADARSKHHKLVRDAEAALQAAYKEMLKHER